MDDDVDDHQIFQAAVTNVDLSVIIDYKFDPVQTLHYLQLANNKPDLIVVDVNMPIMTGFEFCIRLKAICALKDIPVVFYSTSSSIRDIARAQEAGAVGYITKSMNYSDLCNVIAFLIGKVKRTSLTKVHLFPNVKLNQ